MTQEKFQNLGPDGADQDQEKYQNLGPDGPDQGREKSTNFVLDKDNQNFENLEPIRTLAVCGSLLCSLVFIGRREIFKDFQGSGPKKF